MLRVSYDIFYLQTLEGVEAKTVRDALKTWRDGYINVQKVMDEFVTLRERTKYLRDEVNKRILFIFTLGLRHYIGGGISIYCLYLFF